MGTPATPNTSLSAARTFANSRRVANAVDWAYVVFVVDSLNDGDGLFADDRFAYAYLNGPLMVMTYDNDGWGIGRMNLVTAHESGHIFGALDEYPSSNCSISDTWGYLNVANASCNNGGNTSDRSIMGDSVEQGDPAVDISTSARGAIGWRSPTVEPDTGAVIVDVVRTATISLIPFAPDPTTDGTPTHSASAGNTPYPPGGCNTRNGNCIRTPVAVSIARVSAAHWRLDAGPFSSDGVHPDDGTFDSESEGYTFTPASAIPQGTHSFTTRIENSFGDLSASASDTLTIGSSAGVPHDDFASASEIAALPFADSLDTGAATLQSGEPQPTCASAGSTVWYRVAPLQSSRVRVDTSGSGFDTVLAVYEGADLGTLRAVACNDDHDSSAQSLLSFFARAGHTYYIQAGGRFAASGTLAMSVTRQPIDAFAQAAKVSLTTPYRADVNTVDATLEPGEPVPTCGVIGRTVWFRFVPSRSGRLAAKTIGSDFNTVLAAYRGSTLGSLNEVACNDDRSTDPRSKVSLDVRADRTYYFQVGGWEGDSGELVFRVKWS